MGAVSDEQFARTAVEYGLLSEEDVHRCRARLAERRPREPGATLAGVARELGLLSAYQIAALQDWTADPSSVPSPLAPGEWPLPDPGASPRASAVPPETMAEVSGPTPPLRRTKRSSVILRSPLPEQPLPGGLVPAGWLGAGPFGRVVLAEPPGGGPKRAVKLVGVDPSSPVLAALTALCSRLSALEHPGILRVQQAVVIERTLHLISPAVDGLSLLQLSERVPLTVERSCQIVLQACRVLEIAHGRAASHGNLKPENVYLTKTQEVVLGDFGLFWALVDAPFDHDTNACPFRCLAPELLEERRPTAAADVYGLGAVLYELAARAPLYSGPCEEVRRAVRRCSPIPPSRRNTRISPTLETILLQALHPRPERRYRSPAELAADLGAFLQGSPIAASGERWLEKVRRLFRRRDR